MSIIPRPIKEVSTFIPLDLSGHSNPENSNLDLVTNK